MQRSVEALIAEGAAADISGWDFSFLAGRARKERPPWGYALALADRLGQVASALDLQTGGGEVFAFALGRARRVPERVVATQSYAPNAALARERLGALGVGVVEIPDDAPVPVPDSSIEFVSSRHPVTNNWSEIARVLRPGGRLFSQQIGAGTNRELTDFIMGPQPINPARRLDRAIAAATAAGLVVNDAREATLRVEFFDVGAVVYFLRKVCWTVPGFSAERYHDALVAMHEHIAQHGAFVCHSRRFLLEAQRSIDAVHPSRR
ncbi:MAG: methyltransferase domain-containing protein [Actinomycetota bacterium]|nr:methyltransferase domain-containing protein [Actinomycetota bacterium]